MSNSIEQFDLNEEWPVYDDGPITIDDPIVAYKTFNEVSWIRLKEMTERWPAIRKSWEAFIIDYNVCLSQIHSEESLDDIPF
jgi:hypothetical protein